MTTYIKAYLANSLFSESDILYNAYLAEELREAFPYLDLYVPQENMEINDKQAYASSTMIADGDDKHLYASKFMIAVIDTVDEGVACEVGSFQTYGWLTNTQRPVFALYTDSRQDGRDNTKKIKALQDEAVENQFPYKNLYYVGKIKKSGGEIFSNVQDLIDGIRRWGVENSTDNKFW